MKIKYTEREKMYLSADLKEQITKREGKQIELNRWFKNEEVS